MNWKLIQVHKGLKQFREKKKKRENGIGLVTEAKSTCQVSCHIFSKNSGKEKLVSLTGKNKIISKRMDGKRKITAQNSDSWEQITHCNKVKSYYNGPCLQQSLGNKGPNKGPSPQIPSV